MTAYCIERCGRVAVGERPIGVTRNGELVTELVCPVHRTEATREDN